jgi:hypothetical protein
MGVPAGQITTVESMSWSTGGVASQESAVDALSRPLGPRCGFQARLMPNDRAAGLQSVAQTFPEASTEGVQFIVNDKGQKVAVRIDLHKDGELWEDVYDSLSVRLRAEEPRETIAPSRT